MRIISCCMGLLGFVACGDPVRNYPINKFVWDVLFADQDASQAENKGSTDLAAFLSEMERFPWYDQGVLANEIGKVSPTLSVTDYKTDRTLFISASVGHNSNLGYFIGYIYPKEQHFLGCTRKFRAIDMYELEDMNVIREMVRLVFDRNEVELHKILSRYPFYARTKEDASWRKYLSEKQKYSK